MHSILVLQVSSMHYACDLLVYILELLFLHMHLYIICLVGLIAIHS